MKQRGWHGKKIDMVGLDDLTAYTRLKRGTCLRVLEAIQKECGEIGNEQIEDNYISFEVYRAYFEDPPREIKNAGFTLKLVDKFDDPYFTLIYRIQTRRTGAAKPRKSSGKKGRGITTRPLRHAT